MSPARQEIKWISRYLPHIYSPAKIPHEWLAEFEAAAKRPLEQRMRYAFIKTYRPVLNDVKYRWFEIMAECRDWCERELPDWLGYGRV
jgi:hypothetical protein